LTTGWGAPVVAVVGGRPIALSRLEARLADIRRGPRGRHLPPDGGEMAAGVRRWVVQELVTEAILLHEAQAAGIAPAAIAPAGHEADPAHDGAGTAALSPEIVARLVDWVTTAVTVDPRAVRAYYVRNGDRYRRREARRVRHILLPDKATAREVIDRLADGGAFGDVAEQASLDAGSRTMGGDLGDVHRGEFSGAFEDAIFSAEVGVVLGPIRTEHGWHVAQVEAVTPASPVPYREARPAIEAELLGAERSRVFGAWLEERRRALVAIEPGFEHPADPVHGFPSHRH
jgi:hypothetical protein